MPDLDAETYWDLPETDAVRQYRAGNPFFMMPCGRYALVGSGPVGNSATVRSPIPPFLLYRIGGKQRHLFTLGT